MRKKYSPQDTTVQGNVLLSTVTEDSLHLAAAHVPSPENATFEELLALRYELEKRSALKRGLRHLPDPSYLTRRAVPSDDPDPRFYELSLTRMRAQQQRKKTLSRLSVR
ncbi:MAG: hypothetical protein RSF90_01020 [Pygmaiobacter sp.]